jgi:hypothetical protein
MNAHLQSLILTLIVAWSVWSLLRRYFPKPVQRFKEKLALRAEHHGWFKVATSLRKVTVTGSDCSSGCSSCHGCDTPTESVAEEKPVTIRSSSSHC